MSDFCLPGPSVDHPFVEAWSRERLRFEPKGWQLKFRADLRQALRKLSFVPEYHLAASYASLAAGYCDVENILFYNVGTTYFSHLARKGMCFERLFSLPPVPENIVDGWKHYVSYALAKPNGGLTYWYPFRSLARWSNVPCGIRTGTPKVVLCGTGLSVDLVRVECSGWSNLRSCK